MTKNELWSILMDFSQRFENVSKYACLNEEEKRFFNHLSLAMGMMGVWLDDDLEKDREGP